MSSPTVFHSTTVHDLSEFVQKLIAHTPALEGRMLRGATYLLADRIHALAAGTYKVQGTAEQPYVVTLGEGASCTCVDYTQARAPRMRGMPCCKHILGCLALFALTRRAARRQQRAARLSRVQRYRRLAAA